MTNVYGTKNPFKEILSDAVKTIKGLYSEKTKEETDPHNLYPKREEASIQESEAPKNGVYEEDIPFADEEKADRELYEAGKNGVYPVTPADIKEEKILNEDVRGNSNDPYAEQEADTHNGAYEWKTPSDIEAEKDRQEYEANLKKK